MIFCLILQSQNILKTGNSPDNTILTSLNVTLLLIYIVNNLIQQFQKRDRDFLEELCQIFCNLLGLSVSNHFGQGARGERDLACWYIQWVYNETRSHHKVTFVTMLDWVVVLWIYAITFRNCSWNLLNSPCCPYRLNPFTIYLISWSPLKTNQITGAWEENFLLYPSRFFGWSTNQINIKT